MPVAPFRLRIPCRALRLISALVGILGVGAVAYAAPQTQSPPGVPTDAEQHRMLLAMQDYAARYIENLPNFICEQVTQQFEAGKKPTHWHRGDTLTSRLVYNSGREDKLLERVNNKPVPNGFRPFRTPLVTEGEFGLLLATIFSAKANAAFTWNRWDVINGRRVAVFDFAVDGSHSSLRIGMPDVAEAIVPYHGSIFGDPETGAVWRIIDAAENMPREAMARTVSTTIDYDHVTVGDRQYLLPVQAVVNLDTGSNNIRNEIGFQGYRKFEAESTITYTTSEPETARASSPPQ